MNHQTIIEQKIKQLNNSLSKCTNYNEYIPLLKEISLLQRKMSLLKCEETAILINTFFPQDTGTPCPYVISNDFRIFLLYSIDTTSPSWNKFLAEICVLDKEVENFIALVSFANYYCFRFGGINDEVLHAHPLYNHGLECYQIHEVINSSWISEQKKINSIHSNFNEIEWNEKRHFVFTFHDNIFECIANDFSIKAYKGYLESVISIANQILLK